MLGLTLDEPNETDFISKTNEFTFLANADLRSLIEKNGGLFIDFIETFFGSALSVKFADTSSCQN